MAGPGLCRCSARPDDVLALAAQLIDAEVHDVARLQRTGGVNPIPTPGGFRCRHEVARLDDEELAQVVTMKYGSKIMFEVEPVCRRMPLTSSHMPRAGRRRSSGVTSHGLPG
jgi:hypothetical protein